LANARGGALCSHHEIIFGNRCHVRDCLNQKIVDTEACIIHQALWQRHKQTHSRDHLMGVRRMLQRPQEPQPWQTQQNHPYQPHDEEGPDIVRKHFFSPARSYCVETLVAPCGVVIAWTTFDKSESPTNILDFLKTIYPKVQSRPSYVCIDKGCQVLRTSIANGSWEEWEKTTRFIVDSYTIIQITKPQICYVQNTVILHQLMDQLLTWCIMLLISMVCSKCKGHLTHK